MIRVGVIGYGYWGPNLVRNFYSLGNATVTYLSDLKEENLSRVRSVYPAVRTTRDVREMLGSEEVDAVAIATPVSTHFDLAMQALDAGKHVLVEKPLAESSEKCDRLLARAKSAGRRLMVDHTFPYTGAVRKIKELIDKGELGEIYYYDSVRVNLGLFQHDVSVIWDLAVHDLSILDYLLPYKPVAVSATGMSHVAGQPENTAYLTLFFENTTIAHIHVNWLAPVKVRQTLIGGAKKMIVYDDLEPSEKVKVYDKGVTLETKTESIHDLRVGYRAGDMWAPQVERTEALRLMASGFVRYIEEGVEPVTTAESGRRVVRAMEAATESMAERGKTVSLD